MNNTQIFDSVDFCRRVHDARLKDQPCATDSIDVLITELTSEGPCQSNSNNRVHVADTVTHSSVQNYCEQSEMTTDFFTYNSHPVQQYLVSSGGEPDLQFEDEQGVANVQQICLREQSVVTGTLKQKRDNTYRAVLSRKNVHQDFLAENTLNENCVQEMSEEIIETYGEFCDGVTTGSNAGYCSSTHSIGNLNTTPVPTTEGLGDAKLNEVESVASEIVPASEVDSLDSAGNFSALKQVQWRDTGQSHVHEAETLVFMDVSSDSSSPGDTNSHASVPRRVERNSVHAKYKSDCVINGECAEEDGGSSSTTIGGRTDEDEDMECHSAEVHSGTVGCKEKFASG
jgi:hypothetical protein